MHENTKRKIQKGINLIQKIKNQEKTEKDSEIEDANKLIYNI